MIILYLLLGTLLILCHGVFILAGWRYFQGGPPPGKAGTLARTLSQLGLPLLYMAGVGAFFTLQEVTPVHLVHILLILAPGVLFFVMAFFRPFKKAHPFFLPLVNSFFLIAAFCLILITRGGY